MKTIRNYNPELGLTLNDLRMLLMLDDEENFEFGINLIADVLNCVCLSIQGDTTYTFGYKPKQIAYDMMMEKISSKVEEYENELIKQGYTQEDIDEYHSSENDKQLKRETENQ